MIISGTEYSSTVVNGAGAWAARMHNTWGPGQSYLCCLKIPSEIIGEGEIEEMLPIQYICAFSSEPDFTLKLHLDTVLRKLQ